MNKITEKILFLYLIGVATSPLSANALDYTQPKGGFTTVQGLMNYIITPVWEVFAGLAVIMLVVAGILFLVANGDPTKLTQAKHAFIWGCIGIGVAIIAFSITAILKTSLAE